MCYLLTLFTLLANTEIFEKAVGAVVYLSVNNNTLGSGFFIDEKTILTNYHVIKDARTIIGHSYQKNIYKNIRVIRYDTKRDVAILRIQEPFRDSYLKFSNEEYKVGQKVYVLGHPMGQQFSFSDGIISKLYNDENQIEIIQTTAVVAPGSSGGPMLNESGEIIGIIHSGMVSTQGINFGTSSNSILQFIYPYQEMIAKMIADQSANIGQCKTNYGKKLKNVELKVYGDDAGNIRISTDSNIKTFDYCLRDIVKKFNLNTLKEDFSTSHDLIFVERPLLN